MLPSEVIRLMKFLKEVLRSRIENLKREISLTLAALVSVSKNTLIWVLNMTPSPVSLVWTSTSSLRDQEAESDLEEDVKAELEPNTELARMKPWNGSKRSMTELFTTDLFGIFKYNHFEIKFLS